jgi:hypothetical protein
MKVDDVKIRNYGNINDPEYGTSSVVKIGKLTLWFSGEIVVAFSAPDVYRVCENVGDETRGKHIDLIDNGEVKNRVPYDKFMKELEDTLASFGLIDISRPQMECLTCGSGRIPVRED